MAINFPSSPTVDDEHTDANGTVWVCTDNTVGDVQWARKVTVDTFVKTSGDTMTGQLKGIAPVANEDMTRKDYVDQKAVDEAIAFAIALGG
jgi:hypothetical protein